MKAELVSIGTEILLGEIVDTNANYLAGELSKLGIDLYWISQIGDNHQRLLEVLERAWQRSELIITTGGLGPTRDDITRETVASLLGEPLTLDPKLAEQIEQFFTRRGLDMPKSNLKQANVIPSAQAIYNARGTAPGWWVEKDNRILVAMPGPPAEMQPMWKLDILPRLSGVHSGALVCRTLKTAGLSEALVGEMVAELLEGVNPTMGIYARADGIHLRLACKAETEVLAQAMIETCEKQARHIIGDYIWGCDEDRFETVVLKLLKDNSLSLGMMESFTGGLLAATLTDTTEGFTGTVKGGLILTSAEGKISHGVAPDVIERFGNESQETTEAMASAVRHYFGADIGIAVGGEASGSAQQGINVKMWIAISKPGGTRVFGYTHVGDSQVIKRRAVTTALFKLRESIITPPAKG